MTCNIEAHCIGWPANGQLKSRTKKYSESENNVVGHMTFLASQHVSQGATKILTLTNIIQYIENMFTILHISII